MLIVGDGVIVAGVGVGVDVGFGVGVGVDSLAMEFVFVPVLYVNVGVGLPSTCCRAYNRRLVLGVILRTRSRPKAFTVLVRRAVGVVD